MEQVENGYMEFRPTLMQRFWRALGFRKRWDEALFEWRSADPQSDDWWKPGVMSTRVTVHVDWLDRLRLFVSGRCEVNVYTRTDVIVEHAETRSDFAVLAPGG